MPLTHNYLKEIILALVQAKVTFVIAGGVAVVLHGVERVTMDLDISLHMTTENLNRFLSVMKNLHMTPRAPVRPEILLDPDQVHLIVIEKDAVVFTFFDKDNPLKQVDVFLQNHMKFDILASDSVTVSIAGESVQIVSKERLIAMKQQVEPMRPKDHWDIEALRKLEIP